MSQDLYPRSCYLVPTRRVVHIIHSSYYSETGLGQGGLGQGGLGQGGLGQGGLGQGGLGQGGPAKKDGPVTKLLKLELKVHCKLLYFKS